MKLIGVKSIFQDYKSHIEDQLNGRSELSICLKVFGYLTSVESFKLQYVTYGTLMQITNCNSEQFADLVKATDFLTTPNAHILDMYFEYCDEQMEDPEPIDNGSVHKALTDGQFYHPLSGETIYNFSNYIYPVFRPSKVLVAFRHDIISECK